MPVCTCSVPENWNVQTISRLVSSDEVFLTCRHYPLYKWLLTHFLKGWKHVKRWSDDGRTECLRHQRVNILLAFGDACRGNVCRQMRVTNSPSSAPDLRKETALLEDPQQHRPLVLLMTAAWGWEYTARVEWYRKQDNRPTRRKKTVPVPLCLQQIVSCWPESPLSIPKYSQSSPYLVRNRNRKREPEIIGPIL